MDINIVGTIFGSSGYDLHTRQLFNAIAKNSVVKKIRLDCQKPADWVRYCSDIEFKAIQTPFSEDMTTICIATPNMWKTYLAENPKNFIGFLVWEGDSCPEYWLDYLLDERVSQIWVPSLHTKQAIDNTLKKVYDKLDETIINKIKIVPHGVNLDLFKPKIIPRSNNFVFIANKGWRGTSWDRGGIQYLLKAFAEEFKNDEPVELIIKLNPAYINPVILNQSVAQLQLPQSRAIIKIGIENINYENLIDFYNQGDVFICPTRAEGFNLPGIEAMACSLPTIQTNYGGQTDYMNGKNSLFIDYKLEEIKEDLMYEGIQWANPDIISLKKQMRWAYENKDKVKEMGQQALLDSKNWSWEISAEKAITFIKEI